MMVSVWSRVMMANCCCGSILQTQHAGCGQVRRRTYVHTTRVMDSQCSAVGDILLV
jgi:hypothetical protein